MTQRATLDAMREESVLGQARAGELEFAQGHSQTVFLCIYRGESAQKLYLVLGAFDHLAATPLIRVNS